MFLGIVDAAFFAANYPMVDEDALGILGLIDTWGIADDCDLVDDEELNLEEPCCRTLNLLNHALV